MKAKDRPSGAQYRMGWVDSSLYALARLLSLLSRGKLRLQKYYIMAQPIGRGATPSLRADPRTVIDWAERGSPLCQAFPRPSAVIERRYRHGARCLAASVKGRFAGFIWVQRERYEEDEVRCTYVLRDAQQAVWDFDVYVAPEFRWGRTMARLWEAADDRLAAEGVRWSLSRISAFKPESLAAHRRLGAVEIDRLVFFRAGRSQSSWRRFGRIYRPLRADGAGPTLELSVPGTSRTVDDAGGI